MNKHPKPCTDRDRKVALSMIRKTAQSLTRQYFQAVKRNGGRELNVWGVSLPALPGLTPQEKQKLDELIMSEVVSSLEKRGHSPMILIDSEVN